MRIKFIYFFLLLFQATSFAEAIFSVSGEWLYFMPSFDQSDYVVDGNLAASGTLDRDQIDQQYRSGYRINATYNPTFCFPTIEGRYTRFRTKLSSTKTSPSENLFPILGVPGIARLYNNSSGSAMGEQWYSFDQIEGLIYPLSWTCSCFSFDLFTGVKYAYLHFTDELQLNRTNAGDTGVLTVTDELTSMGIGPQIGISGNYIFWKCFSFVGRFEISPLVSCAKNYMTESDTQNSIQNTIVQDPKEFWHVIGSYNCRLGLSFCKNFHCIKIACQGGYELTRFSHFLKRMYFVDANAEGLSFNEWSDYTMQGPYLQLSLRY